MSLGQKANQPRLRGAGSHERTCAEAFACYFDECGFESSDSKRLADHLVEEHQAPHDLKCPFCEEWFRTPYGLRVHEQSVHKRAQNSKKCTCGYATDEEHLFASHQEHCNGETQVGFSRQSPYKQRRTVACPTKCRSSPTSSRNSCKFRSTLRWTSRLSGDRYWTTSFWTPMPRALGMRRSTRYNTHPQFYFAEC